MKLENRMIRFNDFFHERVKTDYPLKSEINLSETQLVYRVICLET